jgi:hypothetical protein
VSSQRPGPEIQNTFQQNKWYASARAATFGFSRGSIPCLPTAERNSQALPQQGIPTMLRITIYAILIVTLIMGDASAQTDKQGLPGYSNAARNEQEKKNDKELDRAYESTIKGRPDAKQKNSDPWADVRSAPPPAAAKNKQK